MRFGNCWVVLGREGTKQRKENGLCGSTVKKGVGISASSIDVE